MGKVLLCVLTNSPIHCNQALFRVRQQYRILVTCRVQAWDLSRNAVLMTHINTTLWGIPCTTIHGDTLRLEAFDSFRNIHSWAYPFPKSEAKETTKPRVLELGKGHEQLALFEFDKAA
jgi:hypothetical protein